MILEEITKLRLPPKDWQIPYGEVNSQRLNLIPTQSDPFDRARNESIEVQLAQYVYQKTNATIFTCKDLPCERFLINYFPGISRKILTVGDVHFYDPVVTTGYSGYQFLTCHTQSIFTLEFYIKPFQPEIWLGLFLCLGLLTFIMTVWMPFKFEKEQETRRGTFSPWIYLLASIFEESASVPSIIEIQYFFRIVLGFWSLVSVVLTNGYNGIMIEDFVAPVKHQPPQQFTDLICGTEYYEWISVLKSYQAGTLNTAKWNEFRMGFFDKRVKFWSNRTNSLPMRNDMPKISNDCFRLLSRIDMDLVTPEYEFLHFVTQIWFLGQVYDDRWADISSSDVSNLLLLLHLANFKFAYTPQHGNISRYGAENLNVLDAMVEADVINCGRTVLISKSNMINAEYDYLSGRYPATTFYKGKQILEANQQGWLFFHAGSSKVPLYYKFILEAGVYAKLDEEIRARKVRYRISPEKVNTTLLNQGMIMSEGVASLFYICLVVISLSLLCFVGEGWHLILRQITIIFGHIRETRKAKNSGPGNFILIGTKVSSKEHNN